MKFSNRRPILACELALLLAGAMLSSYSLQKLLTLRKEPGFERDQRREVLYLPSGSALGVVSFGYRNTLADILWFNTINYFGKHYAGDQNYLWLYHMCDLVTSLDPRAVHVYQFGGTMLGWELNLPEKAIALLDKAIKNVPNDWHLYYLRGFTLMFFMRDPTRAHADFVKASEQPGAPPITVRLAAKTLVANSSPEEAIEFLLEAMQTATDPNARGALLKRLNEARYERDLRALEQALRIFEEKNGVPLQSLQQLVQAGIIKSLPEDPFRGTYYLDGASHQIMSTSGRKRSNLFR